MKRALVIVVMLSVAAVATFVVVQMRGQATAQIRSTEGIVVKRLDFEDAAGRIFFSHDTPIEVRVGRREFIDFPGSTENKNIKIAALVSNRNVDTLMACEMRILQRTCVGEIYVDRDKMTCAPCVRD